MPSFAIIPGRALDRNDPVIPCLGLELMSNSGVYGIPGFDEDRLAFLDHAYKHGETSWDTSDKYGDSEDHLGTWIAENPEKRMNTFFATKFGMKSSTVEKKINIDSTPEYCHEAIESSLERLGFPYVYLFFVHSLDKVKSVGKKAQTMVELKNASKIRYLGLSECSAESWRRAGRRARELGIAIVCYGPLGNGFVGGELRSCDDVTKPRDSRGVLPWLSGDNLDHNLGGFNRLSDFAEEKRITMGQLALAWLLTQGDDIFLSRERLRLKEEKAIPKLSSSVVGGRFQNMTGYALAHTPKLPSIALYAIHVIADTSNVFPQ
ncbi:NADP-dependent oxidoreductase domain-containing protein [Talaromyces proteolyticus]|uniref:NADP-dependent oxidoreductase domain-containing protein n=1 Tax=Talaromyces proteolyticus TaxID=1131652 RepID=A0AAD4PVG8_9EURO|nr:NADP-dependent oxidoreductase domain-containing protein [Talaromyces proteolyticus]KAH8690683.1 NADP-dependent oxidoreductase domain-containing protein [Talaromyces proteolyticus]